MTETRPDAGQPDERSMPEPPGPAAGKPASGTVPDKQIGRWKDDGGAVDLTG